MKKVMSIFVSLMMVLVFSGTALCGEAAAPEKKKPAKVKKVHLKKSEYTNGPHVSVMGGVAFLTDSDLSNGRNLTVVDTDPGYMLGVAAGYRFGDKRVEAELGYQKNCVDENDNLRRAERSGDLKAYSLLVNGYYDFVKGKKMVPFVTAGIGIAKVDADVNGFAHEDDVAAAYQVGAGMYYTITDNWHIELKYRYFDTFENLRFGNSNPEFSSHNVLVGIRYRF